MDGWLPVILVVLQLILKIWQRRDGNRETVESNEFGKALQTKDADAIARALAKL